jgi:anti-anti-sigma factor
MDVKLVAECGRSRGQAVDVKAAKFFIGNHANCQLRPEIPELAGIHALVEQREGRVLLRDMGTEGGTLLNDRLLRSKEMDVAHGDRIKIGPLELSVAIAPRLDMPSLPAVPPGWPFAEAPVAAPAPAAAAPKATPAEGPQIKGEALRYETVGDVLVVTLLNPDLTDESTVGPMRYEFRALLEHGLPNRVVVDLGNVTYLSSRAVGVILAHYQGLDRQGGSLRVCRVHPRVLPVLEQMRLQMLIDIYPTVEEAVETSWEEEAEE